MRVSRAFIVYRALIGHPCSSRGIRPRLLFFTFDWKDSLVFSPKLICKTYIFFIKRLKTDEFVVIHDLMKGPRTATILEGSEQ
jgi:hypothetical protein